MTTGNSVFDFDADANRGRRALTASAVEAILHSQVCPINDTENGGKSQDDIIQEQNEHIKLLEQKQLNLRSLKRDPGFLDIALSSRSYKKPRASQIFDLYHDVEFADDGGSTLDHSKPIMKQERSVSPERHIKMCPEKYSVANTLDLKCEIKKEDSMSPQKTIKIELGQEYFANMLLENSSSNPIVIDDDEDSDLIILDKEIGLKQEICSIEIDSPPAEVNGLNDESPQKFIKVEPDDKWIEGLFQNNSSKNPIVIDDESDKDAMGPILSSNQNDENNKSDQYLSENAIRVVSTKPSIALESSFEFDQERAAERVQKYDNAAEQTALGCKVTGKDDEKEKDRRVNTQSADEGTLFVASSDTEDQCNARSKKTKRKAYKPVVKKVPNIREGILNNSMEIGLQYIAEMHERRKGSRKSGTVGVLTNSRLSSDAKLNLGKGRDGCQKSINWTSNVFKDICKNLDGSDEPSFTSATKEEAFKEMKAKLDLSKPANKRDLKALERAWEDFHGKASVKSDGNGQWSVKGMKSSLRSYQLVGVAFLRRRENGSTTPRGGLDADVMGLGKTVMMLANIVNDKLSINPLGRKKNKTTLIVTTAGLVSQWSDEIKNHCEREYAGKVMVHRAGCKIDSHDPKELLQEHDIIITTYHEVMRSYPAVKPPPELKSLEGKQTWWKSEFEVKRGVLHRIYFRRIVLDEAAVMKNYTGRTSMACQALMGKYRWAVTGTPIQNTPLEFYPLFKFLDIPHASTVEMFKRNFFNERDSASISRLRTILDQVTLRRTHLDHFFEKPLLPLKSAREKTYSAKFNDFERSIYNLMMKNIQRQLNEVLQKSDSNRQVTTVFTMLMRLRQLTSHFFLTRGIILDYLTKKDITMLRTLARKIAKVEDYGEQMYQIRQMIAETKTVDMKKSISNCRSVGEDTEGVESDCMAALDPSEDAENGNLRRYDARRFISQLEETRKRKIEEEEKQREPTVRVKLCDLCKLIAEKPFITDCNHVYCFECFTDLQENLFGELAGEVECIHCGANCTIEQVFETDEARNEPNSNSNSKTQTLDRCKRRRGHNINGDNDIINWIKKSPNLHSAKGLAVIGQIKNWRKQDPDAKIIVYTHFIDMIEILGHMCRTEKWEYCEYHGKQTMRNRDKALKTFEDNCNIGILLMSIKCGGLGLNITIASRVIIVDPWWNSSVEEQAFCRVFRHGQTKETRMTRIVVSGSVDDKIIKMQEKKRENIDRVMSSDENVPKPSLEELVSLFEPIEDPHDNEGFVYDFQSTDAICWTSDDDDDEESHSETANNV